MCRRAATQDRAEMVAFLAIIGLLYNKYSETDSSRGQVRDHERDKLLKVSTPFLRSMQIAEWDYYCYPIGGLFLERQDSV